MADDAFNMSMRKFLKRMGVTSQQEIEESVRAAREKGGLKSDTVKAKMVLTIEETGLTHVVEGDINVTDD